MLSSINFCDVALLTNYPKETIKFKCLEASYFLESKLVLLYLGLLLHWEMENKAVFRAAQADRQGSSSSGSAKAHKNKCSDKEARLLWVSPSEKKKCSKWKFSDNTALNFSSVSNFSFPCSLHLIFFILFIKHCKSIARGNYIAQDLKESNKEHSYTNHYFQF